MQKETKLCSLISLIKLVSTLSGIRTLDPLIKSQLLSQMTQTKPILKIVQTSFIALSSLFHVKLDLLLFEFAFFKQPDTTPKSNTIH